MTMTKIYLKRVPYGKENTLDEDKEYQMLAEGFAVGPVGTLREWKKTYPESEFIILGDKNEN